MPEGCRHRRNFNRLKLMLQEMLRQPIVDKNFPMGLRFGERHMMLMHVRLVPPSVWDVESSVTKNNTRCRGAISTNWLVSVFDAYRRCFGRCVVWTPAKRKRRHWRGRHRKPHVMCRVRTPLKMYVIAAGINHEPVMTIMSLFKIMV